MTPCMTEGCQKPYRARGYCSGCYNRLRESGELQKLPPGERRRSTPGNPRGPLLSFEERFWSKVDRSGGPDACWLWLAARTTTGYGQFNARLKPFSRKAHRVAYQLVKGDIPEGLHLDHLCRTPLCVNPAHLEAVTCAENLRRSPYTLPTVNGAKTHCPSGHAYTAANTYIHPRTGDRKCRECGRIRDAARYERRLAERRRRRAERRDAAA